jgi:hypothetical protein
VKRRKEWSGQLTHHHNDAMTHSKISPDPGLLRTVSTDPGLLSNEELLVKLGNRRFTLERIIAKERPKELSSLSVVADGILRKARKRVRWFVDHAQLKISVRSRTAKQ